MTYANRFVSLWSLTTVTLIAMVHSVAAAPPLRLTTTEAGEFHQAVMALAEQGHVAVVAEGVPLHPHLSVQEAAKLEGPLSLDDAVKAVANAYDYSSQREGNVYVLKKRYSDPDDLSVLTPAECSHALALLQQVAEPFNSHSLVTKIQFLAPPGPHLRRDQVRILDPPVDAFVASLTADQKADMEKNKLFVSSLSQPQKALARQIRLALYVQTPMDLIALLLPLSEQARQSAIFCWQNTPSAQHVFGYALLEKRGDQSVLRFHALSHSTGSEDFNSYSFDTQPAGPDPTDPGSISHQPETGAAQTLADAIASLNARSGGAIHANVDPAVAAKPVTIAGAGNASAGQILQALADVYGLRLVNSTPGGPATSTLTLPDILPPSELAELPSSLRQAFPEPFARATHLDKIVADEQQFYNFWQTPRYPKHSGQVPSPSGAEETPAELEQAMLQRKRENSGNVEFNAGLEHIEQAKATLSALRNAAIRRLRTLIEPKLQAHPNGIAISDLGEQEHDALATIFLVEAAQAAGDLITQKVPDTALHFDQAVLSGGIHEDAQPPVFEVQFHIPNPAGGLEIDGGGISVPYYKDYGKEDKK